MSSLAVSISFTGGISFLVKRKAMPKPKRINSEKTITMILINLLPFVIIIFSICLIAAKLIYYRE
jgi:hypothetical protein